MQDKIGIWVWHRKPLIKFEQRITLHPPFNLAHCLLILSYNIRLMGLVITTKRIFGVGALIIMIIIIKKFNRLLVQIKLFNYYYHIIIKVL